MKRIEIRDSAIDGKGLFAAEPIKRGERIQFIQGATFKKVIKKSDEAMALMNSIGVGRHLWIDTEGTPFRYINHSCEPNAAIVGTKTVIAIKNIPKDGEIFMDYSLTDADPLWSMKCSCGAKTCRGTISSIQSIPIQSFKKHLSHIPRNFQRIYLKNYVSTRTGREVLKKPKAAA